MFTDIVEQLRLIVGAHGAQGCALPVASDALEHVVLPRYRIALNPIIGASIFELLRSEVHITVLYLGHDAAPGDWPTLMWSDPTLARCFVLQASRSLQSYACGIHAGMFMRPSMWSIIDHLGQSLARGATREQIRAVCDDAMTPQSKKVASHYYMSIRDLKLEGVITTCAVKTRVGFEERYFLSTANPCIGSGTMQGVFSEWLQWLRRHNSAVDEAKVTGTPPDSEALTQSSGQRKRAGRGLKEDDVEVDDEDEDDHEPVPSFVTAGPEGGSVASIAVDDDILIRSVQVADGVLSLPKLTRRLLRWYNLPFPPTRSVLRISATAVASQCRQLSALRVVDGPTATGQSVVCLATKLTTLLSAPQPLSVKSDDNATTLATTASVKREVTTNDDVRNNDADEDDALPYHSSAAIMTRLPAVDPLMPLAQQILKHAASKPILVEHVKPPLQHRDMRHLIPRLRALISTAPYAGSLEARFRRSASSKTFCLEVAATPAALAAAAAQQRSPTAAPLPTAGISQWARNVVRDALKGCESGVLILETLTELLDTKTIRRIIPVLRAEGSIVTSGLQLPGRRTRVGLILDSDKLATIDEDAKQAAAERYFEALTKSKERAHEQARASPLVKLLDVDGHVNRGGGRRKAAPPANEHAAAEEATQGPQCEGDGKDAVPARGWPGAAKAEAIFRSVANGGAPSYSARSWRLHIELWNVCLRLRRRQHAHTYGNNSSCMMTLKDLLDEMSFSTFCVVVGINSVDVETLCPATVALPWGTPMKRLPDNVKFVCDGHSLAPLFAALHELAACGALKTDIPASVLDPSHMSFKRQTSHYGCHLVLIPTIATADGQRWPIIANHPTAVLRNIGMFWAHARLEAPLTPAPMCNPTRVAKVCTAIEAAASELTPSLAETFAVSRILRAKFPIAAHLSLRALGDLTQLAALRGVSDGIGGASVASKCRGAPMAVVRMLMRPPQDQNDNEEDDTSSSSIHSSDDEGGIGSAARAEIELTQEQQQLDASGPIRRQRRRYLKIHLSRLGDALRVSVSDDTNCYIALGAICKVLHGSFTKKLVEGLQSTLRSLDAAAKLQSPLLSNAQLRGVRLYVLHTTLHPLETPATTTFQCDDGDVGAIIDRYEALRAAAVAPRKSREAAADALRDHADVVGRIQAILLSRWDHYSSAARDALLAPFDPLLIQAVRDALVLVYPRLYTARTLAAQQHRLPNTLRLLRTASRPLPKLSAANLAESSALYQAHALATLPSHICPLDIGRAIDCNRVLPQPSVSELVQQPVGCALGDSLFHAGLSFPAEWETSRQLAQSRLAALTQPSVSEGTELGAPTEMALRDPAATAIAPYYQLSRGAPALRGETFPSPTWMRGTAFSNTDGTVNLTMVYSEAHRVRALLMTRPGISRDRVVDYLCADGLVSSAAIEALLTSMIGDGLITTKSDRSLASVQRHPLTNAVAQVRTKRPRWVEGDDDAAARDVSLHWNAASRPWSVTATPLELVCPRSTMEHRHERELTTSDLLRIAEGVDGAGGSDDFPLL